MNHLQKSELIEETCKDYLRNLSQSGHEVQTGDTWAILLLASDRKSTRLNSSHT